MSAMRWALLLTACCGRLCEGQDTPYPDNGFAEKLGSADWRAVQLLMEEQLGTPASPRIRDELPLDYGSRDLGAGKIQGWKLRQGQALYLRHCLKCHGRYGQGSVAVAGKPGAAARDFRRGFFKWMSTQRFRKPCRHDLRETIRLGLPGTSMPAFKSLDAPARSALVEYVRWLAMRGEIERRVCQLFFDDYDLDEFEQAIDHELPPLIEPVAKAWQEAELESAIVRPENRVASSPESIQRGSELWTKSLCHKCHAPDATGSNAAYLKDIWGNSSPAWDLHSGAYRGGTAPDDIYRRISIGIAGSPMPAASRALSPLDIWDLVNFCVSLQTPAARLKQVARKPPPPGADKIHKIGQKSESDTPFTEGWGTVKGRFLFGPRPDPVPLQLGRDAARCGKLFDESIVVGDDGGLANVVVYLENASPPVHPRYAAAPPPAKLAFQKCQHTPRVQVIRTDQTLVLANEDRIATNFNLAPVKAPPVNIILPAGRSQDYQITANQRAPVRSTCNIHPWVLSYVLARDNPYAAVSGKTGEFVLRDVPAGERLTLRLWHERASAVPVKGSRIGRLTITVLAGETTDLGDLTVTPEMLKLRRR